MSEDIKSIAEIKTHEERIHGLWLEGCDVTDLYVEEISELRAAYEALQKENAELKESAKLLDEMLSKVIDERNNAEQNMCKLQAESAAQAKRIAELEAELQTIKAWIHNPVGESTLDNLSAQKGTE
jgi:chromosome segregation ATPase